MVRKKLLKQINRREWAPCPLVTSLYTKFHYNRAFNQRKTVPTIDEVRKNIILKDGIYYFDYTASGLAYAPIEDEISNFLKTYANTHSDSSSSAVLTQKRYENARAELKELLGLDESFYLIATGQGATAAIKKFQEIMGIYLPPTTRALIGEANLRSVNLPLVLVGPYEHHSNEISFREGLCDCERI